MFFVTQNGVRKRAADSVRPMLRIMDATGGVPPGLWDDLTATAFLHGCIRAIVEELSNRRYAGRAGVQITLDVLSDIAGQETGRNIKDMHALFLNTASFQEALEAGILSVMVAKHGPEKVKDEPVIQRALFYLGDEQEATGARVSAALQALYFYNRAEDIRGT